MVNLLSNDVNRFDFSPMFIHYLWCGPLQFVIVMYLTYQAIGPATFVGGALIIAMVPFQSWIGRKFSQLRNETAKKTDERIRIMSEIIQGKLYLQLQGRTFYQLKSLVKGCEISR